MLWSPSCIPQNEKCTTMYNIYVPTNLHDCLYVLNLSTSPHNHLLLLPIKMPPQITYCLESFLLQLEWKLADAMLWQLALDSGFILGLQHALGWSYGKCDPSPHDLHSSLSDLDHLHWLINTLQNSSFLNGTGFQGTICLEVIYPLSNPSLQVLKYSCKNNDIFHLNTNIYNVSSSTLFPVIMHFSWSFA